MKNLLSLLSVTALCLGLFVTTAHAEPQTMTSQIKHEFITDLAGGVKDYDCNAWTTCSNGQQISCWSDGDSCTWSYTAGVSVTCCGYGNDSSCTTETCY